MLPGLLHLPGISSSLQVFRLCRWQACPRSSGVLPFHVLYELFPAGYCCNAFLQDHLPAYFLRSAFLPAFLQERQRRSRTLRQPWKRISPLCRIWKQLFSYLQFFVQLFLHSGPEWSWMLRRFLELYPLPAHWLLRRLFWHAVCRDSTACGSPGRSHIR